MYKNIYVMKNKKIGSMCGQFESDEEIVKERKIVAQKRSIYESEQLKVWREFGINRELWDKEYINKLAKDKNNLKNHINKI